MRELGTITHSQYIARLEQPAVEEGENYAAKQMRGTFAIRPTMTEALNDASNDEMPFSLELEDIDILLRQKGRCRGKGPEIYYPVERSGGERLDILEAKAKQFCGECVVRDECLEIALSRREMHGIWGGKTEKERRNILRHRRQST